MIYPISSTHSPPPIQNSTALLSPPLSQSSNSSLCSMERPNLLSRFFRAILDWIKWIFCCKSSSISPPPLIKPQIDPSDLPSSDPFRNTVFNFDSTGKAVIRNEQKSLLACNIFKTLGTGGPWNWYWNRSQLVKWQKELEKFPLNPFEFLYFLFHDQEMSSLMASFKEHGSTATATMVCALIGRKNPWNEFIDQESRSFAAHGSIEMIPGFCKLLQLNQTNIVTLFNDQKWEELVHYILEERKKHFSISPL